ncbi:SMC-Scp complex subunit ScpB [Actinoplanes sp. NPDC051633]|uniref:SMC-Scp complex subunit ScpB n=1 Tax=Actinoplanes sp. NPDC051633 TaxID=3155670 RepID=UPI0034208185
MVSDERPESLASQAASWVPPWERAPRTPDRDFQARAMAEHEAAEAADGDDDSDGEPFEQGEIEPIPGEADERGTVDAPVEVPGQEPAVMDPEIEVPASIEQAEDEPGEEGLPVDAPLPPDGDDAGDVFDLAADDDVSDDGEVDLPFYELPATDEAQADETQADEPAEEQPEREPEPESRAERVPGESPLIPAQVTPMDDGELRAALEAILLVVDEPVAELQLAQIVEQPPERVGAMLEDISARYTAAGHGFDLRRAAGGWRLYTRPEYAAYVERFVLDGQSVRLTQAALETLAVVAYKQPVTRSRISAIRGVNCDGVMRTLATRGLIEECGTEPESGAHLYRTTGLFLEKLGLDSVDQLPPLAPFLPDDVEEVLDASPG